MKFKPLQLFQAATVTDFPRTPLIMCSSLAVIIAIAAVVFFVFKCRQNPPNSEHYTMVSSFCYEMLNSKLFV